MKLFPKIDWKLLASLGLILIGMGALLIGYTMYRIYSKVESSPYPKFQTICVDYYIEITAYDDLKDVKVWFGNTTVCEYDFIPKGSSRVCDATKYINKTKVFVVSSDKGERTVKCLYEQRQIIID